nr:hypothetical protein [Actinomycetota bacterium]
MSPFLYDLIGLIAGVCFILALKGLSHPRTARRGNLLGAAGAGIATLLVFFRSENEGRNLGWIIGAIVVGVIIGVPAARRVQMTAMPQLVALFNGVGGGAAALVAIVEYMKLGDTASFAVVLATVFTVVVGCVSFSGSIITFLKLQELPVAFFTQNKVGDLISRINSDTDKLSQFFAQALVQFVGNFFVITGAGIFLLVIKPVRLFLR